MTSLHVVALVLAVACAVGIMFVASVFLWPRASVSTETGLERPRRILNDRLRTLLPDTHEFLRVPLLPVRAHSRSARF